MDPGAFGRPGTAIVTIVDRNTVRIVGDAPEIDFAVVAPGTKVDVHLLAEKIDVAATVTRRAPSADPGTRTVRFELDVANARRALPVNTTAELHIEVGEPQPAAEIPVLAASVRGSKATLFVVEGDAAKKRMVAVLGERTGKLYVEPSLAGARVVTEGRTVLVDGDRVAAALDAPEKR
jgi:hypothetical protein